MTNFTGPALIATIAAIGGMSFVEAKWDTALEADFEDGATQLALEESFNDGLIIRAGAINGWNAFRYAVFGETLPGAVPGKSSWLFTDEEYTTTSDFEARRAASILTIVETVDLLADYGSQTIVILLPDKARIEVDHAAKRRPNSVELRYDASIDDLRRAGVDVVDVRVHLLNARATDAVFLNRDTHWTPFGAQAVAAAVGPKIMTATDTRASFETMITDTITHEGDLVTFADAGIFNAMLGLGPEMVDIYTTTQAQNGAVALDLFGGTQVPVNLIGTSYSAIPTWNFVGFLKQESQTDILNLAEEGLGPFVPMENYLTELKNGGSGSELVVWEIPERYLTLGKDN